MISKKHRESLEFFSDFDDSPDLPQQPATGVNVMSRRFLAAGSSRRSKVKAVAAAGAEIDVLETRELLIAVVAGGTLVIQGQPGGQSRLQSGAYVEVRNHPGGFQNQHWVD